jgi:hypothetical protein
MGGAPCFGSTPIDSEIMDEIEKAAKKTATVIPRNYEVS